MKKLRIMFALLLLPIFLFSGFTWGANETTTTPKQNVTTGQYVSDASITTKVKSQLLLDKDIKSLGISVTTDKGVVTLTGNVESEMQKTKAVKIASKVSGVKSVKDELVVKPKTK